MGLALGDRDDVAPAQKGEEQHGAETEQERAAEPRDVETVDERLRLLSLGRSSAHRGERVGWVREGVRRRAYWRDEAWVDGVLFGLVDDEFDDG